MRCASVPETGGRHKEGEEEIDAEKRNKKKKKHTPGGAGRCPAACVDVCSGSVMTVCALFCLCVYNESPVIGQVDVVSNGGRGNTLQ